MATNPNPPINTEDPNNPSPLPKPKPTPAVSVPTLTPNTDGGSIEAPPEYQAKE